MSRRRARAGAVLVALLSFLPVMAGLVTQGPPAAAASSIDERNQRGFDELNACLASRQRVDALYVIDVSGSLQFNDPEGGRFEALEASVRQLGVLASAGADSLEVYAALGTFGNSFAGPNRVRGWERVPAHGGAGTVAAEFRRSAEQAWRGAGTNQGTNYEAALDGARTAMQGRGSREDACQVVFWFTDGLFALGDPYDVSATNEASSRMCTPGGTLDKLRQEQVTVIALALTGPDIDAQLSQPQYKQRRGELAAMALGEASGKTCGSVPIRSGWRSGMYLSSDEPAALAALFSGVGAQASGCVSKSLTGTLPVNFDVDPGVRRFQLDVLTPGPTDRLTVQAPGEPPLTLRQRSVAYAGGEVRLSRAGSFASVEVTMPRSVRAGSWSVAMGNTRLPTTITLYRCSDLHIEIETPEPPLRGGTAATLEALVVGSNGEPVDLSVYRGETPNSDPRFVAHSDADADLSAKVSDPERGRVSLSVTPPEDRLSMNVSVSFIPRLRDRIGTSLGQVNGFVVLPLTPPASFPTLTPAGALDLGASKGLVAAQASVTLQGSDRGPSRVCFESAQHVDAPRAAGAVRVTTSVTCQALAKNEQIEVAVSAAPSVSAEGHGRAQIPVNLINAEGQQISEDLVVRWELQRVVDQGTRLWLLVGAVLLAVVLPLVVLALINRMLARFEPGNVRYATYDVRINEEGVIEPARPVRMENLTHTYLQGSDRRYLPALGESGIALRGKAPLNPLGAPDFMATVPAGYRLLSGDGELRSGGREGEVTAGLGAVWVLVLADETLVTTKAPEVITPARLTIITRGEGQSHLDALVTRAETALSEGRWQRIRDQLAEIARREQVPGSGDADPESVTDAHDRPGSEDDPFGLGSDEVYAEPAGRTPPLSRTRGHKREDSSPEEEAYEDPFA
jgi:hypothetical protein